MKKKPFMVRQGDVFVIQVNDDVATGNEIKRDNGRVILAYGEVTGHAHAILDKNVELWEPSNKEALAVGTRILKVLQPATLQHDEHAKIELPAGTYEVRIQREYTPQGLRNVAD